MWQGSRVDLVRTLVEDVFSVLAFLNAGYASSEAVTQTQGLWLAGMLQAVELAVVFSFLGEGLFCHEML